MHEYEFVSGSPSLKRVQITAANAEYRKMVPLPSYRDVVSANLSHSSANLVKNPSIVNSAQQVIFKRNTGGK